MPQGLHTKSTSIYIYKYDPNIKAATISQAHDKDSQLEVQRYYLTLLYMYYIMVAN
jgi:hypothetical protein